MIAELGLNSWATGDRASVIDDIRAAGAAGYRWVELRDAKIERYLASGGRIAEISRAADESGVRVLDVHTLDDATLVTGTSGDALIERCRLLSKWAGDLGARFVTVGPSYGAGPLSQDAILERTAH